ncbi:MAG: folylpolyglutamate synthase/dihydrofolate synthase family protein [Candidatus Micrarchaeota archaeon]|nr:folylpolyglutamate synthase/dihydrofolate synthase family protein [Candidatus Micrarchaeota archaeon]
MKILEEKLAKFGMKLGLERIRTFCSYLGNPQNKMKVILVTGTNGKGSVTSYLSSILKEEGYKTGAYYSPHIKKYNERFQIDGKLISDVKFKKYEKITLDYLKNKKDKIEKKFYPHCKLSNLQYNNKKENELTLFEALTGIAYKYFADENCDFAVMEIGLGGRYDATNIADECISIITNIALEHTEYLGDHVEKIAWEKAGIIKKGISITGAEKEALEIIKIEAKGRNVQLKIINEDFFATLVEATDKHTVFDYIGETFYTKLETNLLGRYQAINAALAVAAAEELGVEQNAIRKGLKNAKNPGRLEIISTKSLVVIDAAHNIHGIKELVKNLDLFKYDKLICVFGVMKDKDWKGMVTLLAPHCDKMIINQIKDERAADADEVARFIQQFTSATAIKDPKKSLVLAKKIAKKDDLILICGSIYMLGKIL